MNYHIKVTTEDLFLLLLEKEAELVAQILSSKDLICATKSTKVEPKVGETWLIKEGTHLALRKLIFVSDKAIGWEESRYGYRSIDLVTIFKEYKDIEFMGKQ